MLHFWFSPQISHLQKLLMCLGIFILTGYSYLKFPMPIEKLILFFVTGVTFVVCYHLQQFFAKRVVSTWVERVLRWLPLAMLLALIFQSLGKAQFLAWGILGLGVVAMTVFLLSPQGFIHSGQLESKNPSTPPHA